MGIGSVNNFLGMRVGYSADCRYSLDQEVMLTDMLLRNKTASE